MCKLAKNKLHSGYIAKFFADAASHSRTYLAASAKNFAEITFLMQEKS